MSYYKDDVEVVEAEVISDGRSTSTEKDYWRQQLKDEFRAKNYVRIIVMNSEKGAMSALGKSYNFRDDDCCCHFIFCQSLNFWAIIHGLLGWFYVIYKINIWGLLTRTPHSLIIRGGGLFFTWDRVDQ